MLKVKNLKLFFKILFLKEILVKKQIIDINKKVVKSTIKGKNIL